MSIIDWTQGKHLMLYLLIKESLNKLNLFFWKMEDAVVQYFVKLVFLCVIRFAWPALTN